MAVESAAVTALVAVVRLFYVRVVRHHEHVVVARALVVSCVHRWRVIHSNANLWHTLLLQISSILLISQGLRDSLCRSGVESTCFFVAS